MKQAVMYGAGNIGRGFIGAQLGMSGYRVVAFVDVAEPLVTHLRESGRYPLRYVSAGAYEDVTIGNVTAVHGSDQRAVAESIASCDVMATAVGARILPFIVENLVAGIRLRWERTEQPLNILICENLMDANRYLEGLIKERLDASEARRFDESVGLVEASIGRMVPVQTDEMRDGEPLRVCVERYGFLPTDADAYKGELPEIQGMIPFSPFDFYIKRKLFVHNMGHAICAYLGELSGFEYIYQAVGDAEIRLCAQNAMLESAMALSARYGVELRQILLHIEDLLSRFGNEALRDTCARVGADPARKLGRADRLAGAAHLLQEQGEMPVYIAIGIAAAIQRYVKENNRDAEASDKKCPAQQMAQHILRDLSGVDDKSPLGKMILDFYGQIRTGASPAQLLKMADQFKAGYRGTVI